MNSKRSLLVVSLLTLFGCSVDTQTASDYAVLTGATIYDGTGRTIENGVIILKNGKIEDIGGPDTAIPKNANVTDVRGKYITPGLVDAHIHFAQTGFFDGRPDVVDLRDTLNFEQLQTELKNNPESYYEAYLRSGVTAVYDVGGFLWSVERQTTAENNPNAPHVAAAGPLLSGAPEEQLAIFNTADGKQMVHLASPEAGRETVIRHSKLGSTGIKIWGINLEDSAFMESLRAVAEEVKAQGNKLIVHATDLDQAKEALRLGAKVLVHSVDDKEVDDEFIRLCKENEAIYLPTLTVMRGYLHTFRSLKEKRVIEDPNGAMDERAKKLIENSTAFYSFLGSGADLDEQMNRFEQAVDKMEAMMAINLKKVYEAGIAIAVATDAGNPGTFHGISIYDEMEAMQQAGLPAGSILTMATKNGAMAMGRAEDFGTLEKGKMADLIILEKDPLADIANVRSITHVMRGGVLRAVNEKF